MLQKVALGGGFYPFGNHAQAQAGAQGHHGAGDSSIVRVCKDIADKTLVNL